MLLCCWCVWQPTECLCKSNDVQKCVWINNAEKHKNVIRSAVGSLHNGTLNYLIHLIQYHLIMFLLNLALKDSTVVFVALQTHVLLTKKVQSDFFWWSQCSSHGWRVFLPSFLYLLHLNFLALRMPSSINWPNQHSKIEVNVVCSEKS